eukprot:TRINITY_DN55580_c0_g2_i1.p1 TRINITY_DN55580_c0_g2~~TRINITY_DN55580_c0_g2_i1.p1  ORF type:complete len:148 (+),score=18.55 TRINITY_DN55580_c0_g2_i1:251-694(+)
MECDEIGNQNGRLMCMPKHNAPNVPPGDYLESCLGCALQGDMVRCTACNGADGEQHVASYLISRCALPGMLANIDGKLVCLGLPNSPNLPEGSYQDSCSGCGIAEPGQLRCSHCFAGDGSQHESVLVLPSNGCDSIGNSDGQLSCSP